MTMLDKYREFAKWASNLDNEYIIVTNKAIGLLHEDFVEQVKKLWAYSLNNSCYAKEDREKIKKFNKIDFVSNCKYSDEKSKFILENWDKLDEIIQILKDYIKEIEEAEEKEEAKEVKEDE